MNDATLERLMMDAAVGGLNEDVQELLMAHLAGDESKTRELGELRQLMERAREAITVECPDFGELSRVAEPHLRVARRQWRIDRAVTWTSRGGPVPFSSRYQAYRYRPAQLDDDSTEDFRIDLSVDVDVAARAGAQLRLELSHLVVVQGTRSNDVCSRFATMLRRQTAERANDGTQLVLAAVAGEYAKEIRRDRIEAELRRDCGERAARFLARHQRTVDELGKVLRIHQGLVQRIEATPDRIDLLLVTRQIEQGRRIAPC